LTRPTSPPADWGRSLWLAHNPPPPPSPPPPDVLDIDVAIVGAGVAGLSAAFHLGLAGIEAVVLEAAAQPFAATAASGGIVAPQLVRNTPASVLARLGPERGPRYLRLVAGSGGYLFGLIRSLGIDCAAQTAGFLNPVPGVQAADRLRGLIEAWTPFRQDLVLANASETARLTGCEGYGACLVDPSGGGLDPVAFVQGLAARLSPSHVQVFRQSPVTDLAPQGAGWRLTTPHGTVTARRVVLCANGGNAGLHPALARTVLPLPVYEVATEPLPPAMRRAILPLGHTLTDSSANVFTIRFDRDGRLITACSANSELGFEALSQAINSRLASTLTAYRETPLQYGWMGTAWLNSNLLARLVAVDHGLYAVQACNGRGLALNTIIGREVARLLEAPGAYDPAIPLEPPRRVPGYGLARHIPGLMMKSAAFARNALRSAADLIRP
jgi:glycine/D-amino acid oxidase-like deaminating enzyme